LFCRSGSAAGHRAILGAFVDRSKAYKAPLMSDKGGLAIPAKGPPKIITAPFGRGNGGLSVPLMNFQKIAKEIPPR
jgi:hypothetical protein